MNPTAQIASDTAPLEVSTAPAPIAPAPRWLDTIAQPLFAIPSLSAVSILMFFANLGGYPFYTKGEPREAVTVLAMVSGGGVILPMRAGVELPSKPLLMHWVAALLSVLAGGVSEWTVRMPSAIFGLAGVLVCYYFVRRLFEQRAAFVAALILATSVQYMQAATGARVDMTLAFFMEIAFFEFLLISEGLTDRRALLYVAIALAILAKGPIGLILPVTVALIWIAVQWRWDLVRNLRLARGAAIVAILAGWWYVTASIIGGRAFIEKQLIAENLVRFLGASDFHEGHAHSFYYLEGALFAGFLPWTPMLALVFWRALRAPRQNDARLTYLFVWFAVVLGFYSFSHSKRGVYLLPLYPPLATIIALYIVDAIHAPRSTERMVAILSAIYGAVLTTAGAALLLALAIVQMWPSTLISLLSSVGVIGADLAGLLRATTSAHLALSLALPAATMALGAYLLRSIATPHKLVLGISTGVILLALTANTIVVPAIATTLALKNFTADVLKAVDDQPIGYLLDLDYDVAFYSRRTIPIVSFKDANKPNYLLCWDSIWAQAPATLRGEYQIVMTSNPTELDGSGRILLLKKTSASAPDEGTNV